MEFLAKLVNPAKKVWWRSFLTSSKALVVFLPIGLVVWGIWVCPKLDILPGIAINDNTPYLLSAIAQSLAAVLALVFTISLIAVQLSSRYSSRVLADFFDRFTIGYIVLFIIAVILPFWSLTKPELYGVKASLVLSAVCLSLLVPYFLGFREKLAPEYMVLKMKERALKELLMNPGSEPPSLITIDNTVMSAFALKDYETFDKGVQALADVAYEAQKREQLDLRHLEAIGSMYYRIDNIASVTIGDPRAPKQVLTALRRTGKKAVSDGLQGTTKVIIARSAGLGWEAAKKDSEDVTHDAVLTLSVLGDAVIEKDWKEATDEIITWLSIIGIEAAKRGMDYPLGEAYGSLVRAGRAFIKKGLKDFGRHVVSSLRDIALNTTTLEEVKQMAYDLVLLGASAINHKDIDIETEIADGLKSIIKAKDTSIIRFAFSKARDYAPLKKLFSVNQEDLEEFAKRFELELSESNDEREFRV